MKLLPLSAAFLALSGHALAGTPVAPAFHEAPAEPKAAPQRQPGAGWWTIFADAELDRLIARGLAQNAEIEIAAARVSLARAAMRGAEAERMPQVTGVAGIAGQTGTLVNAAGGTGALYQLGAAASWEIDLLGRLSKSARAARLDAQGAADLLESTRLITEADIAQTYFALRALDAERESVERGAAEARDALAIAERRQSGGLGTIFDAERLRGELATILADRAALDRQRAATAHALALLVGETGPVALDAWAKAALPEIPAGLPSEMLARRPDVAASIAAIEAGRLRLRVARTAWFPSISLTGSGGQASTSLADLLKNTATSFGFNLLLSLPIFDGGRRHAATAKAKAEVELAEAQNHQVMLRAFREVEDQLSAVRLLGEENAAAATAAEADAHAGAIAERRFADGAISRLDLIDIRRRGLASARRLSQLRFARYAATVNLIRALGGGWSGAPSTAAMARADIPGER